MKITKIETKANGEVTVEKHSVSESNYEISGRFWQASDNMTFIRNWTTDEYINHDPNINKILPLEISGTTIDVLAHTVECGSVYATKDGKRLMMFTKCITYPIDKEKQNENS